VDQRDVIAFIPEGRRQTPQSTGTPRDLPTSTLHVGGALLPHDWRM
jgi:hypothetical protein